MKQIPLSQGKLAIVDDEDYDFLMQWKWFYSRGYAVRSVYCKKGDDGKPQTLWMHKILNNTPIGMQTDHINGDKTDNRKCNLRSVTSQQNLRNQAKGGGSSKYKGVSWCPIAKKWRAYIKDNYKQFSLGKYLHEQDAANAYNNAAKKLHGGYARLNEVAA